MTRAWKLFDEGRRQESIDILYGAVRARPDDDSLRRAYLTAMSDAGLWSQVNDEYWDDFQDHPDGFHAYWYAQAENDQVSSRSALERARRAGAGDAHLKAARALFESLDLVRSGRPDRALEALKRSPLARLDPAAYFLSAASDLSAAGRLDEAEAAATQAAALAPHDVGIMGARAQLRLMRGDADGFRELLQRAGRIGDYAFVHAGLAYSSGLRGSADERLQEYRAALAAPPDGVDWACSVAEARSALGDFWRAYAAALQVRSLDPGETCALGSELALETRLGLHDDALRKVGAALDRNPNDLNALVVMADRLAARGNTDDALSQIDRALALAPGAPDLLITRAELLIRKGDANAAFDALQRAHDVAQNDDSYRLAGGNLAVLTRDYPQMLFHFGMLLRDGIYPAESWKAIGDANMGLRRFDRAARAYARAEALGAAFDRRELAGLIAKAKAGERELARLHPADAGARARPFRRVPELSVCRDAAFMLRGDEVVGCAWGDRSRWRKAEEPVQRDMEQTWSADGRAVYYTHPDGLAEFDPARGKVSYALRYPNKFGDYARTHLNESVIGVFAAEDPGKLYLLFSHADGIRSLPGTFEEFDLASGRRRMLIPGGALGRIDYDRPTRRFFLLGGGNRVYDPSTDLVQDVPTMGCSLDLSLAPGGRAAACVDPHAPDSSLDMFDFTTSTRTTLGLTGANMVWSPDGNTLAYVWRSRELRLMDAVTHEVSVVETDLEPDLDAWNPEFMGISDPVWSPDGRFLYYVLPAQRRRGGPQLYSRATFVIDLKRRESWIAADEFLGFAWRPTLAASARAR